MFALATHVTVRPAPAPKIHIRGACVHVVLAPVYTRRLHPLNLRAARANNRVLIEARVSVDCARAWVCVRALIVVYYVRVPSVRSL